MSEYKVIDLFCGIGGFSYGFDMTRKFDVVLGADIWDVALNTFKENHNETKLIEEDLTKLPDDFWNEYIDRVDVIIAGPPCQGFSMNGQRKKDDKRNSLFEEVVRVTKIIHPKVVVIENVVGLLSMTTIEGKDIKTLIKEKFTELGYNVKYKVLNAADYGVPQQRKRVIFLITQEGIDINYPKEKLQPEKYITVGDALGNVDPNGDLYLEPNCNFQKLMAGRKDICNHVRRKSNDLVTKRMSYIPQGGNWQDIPKELGTGGGTYSNAYRRLDLSKPSITIKHAAKAMIIHPTENRILTVRECARLQSFDDNFVLTGNGSDQHQQLANAVPPLLGKAIAEEVYEGLKKYEEDK